jgi:hypothetical protein
MEWRRPVEEHGKAANRASRVDKGKREIPGCDIKNHQTGIGRQQASAENVESAHRAPPGFIRGHITMIKHSTLLCVSPVCASHWLTANDMIMTFSAVPGGLIFHANPASFLTGGAAYIFNIKVLV